MTIASDPEDNVMTQAEYDELQAWLARQPKTEEPAPAPAPPQED